MIIHDLRALERGLDLRILIVLAPSLYVARAENVIPQQKI